MGVQQSADRISGFFPRRKVFDLAHHPKSFVVAAPNRGLAPRGGKAGLENPAAFKMSVQGGRVSAERKPRRGLAPGSSDNLPRRETRIGGRAFDLWGRNPAGGGGGSAGQREFRANRPRRSLPAPAGFSRQRSTLGLFPFGGSPGHTGRRRDSRA